MFKGHNTFEITKRQFAARGCQNLLWPKATIFDRSQWPEWVDWTFYGKLISQCGYLRPLAAIVYGQRPQYF